MSGPYDFIVGKSWNHMEGKITWVLNDVVHPNWSTHGEPALIAIGDSDFPTNGFRI